jgi:hypothetical protein
MQPDFTTRLRARKRRHFLHRHQKKIPPAQAQEMPKPSITNSPYFKKKKKKKKTKKIGITGILTN